MIRRKAFRFIRAAKWFAGNFDVAACSIMKFVTPFRSAPDQTALVADGFAIAYSDYDGALNDRIRP